MHAAEPLDRVGQPVKKCEVNQLGFFEKIFGKKKAPADAAAREYFKMLDGYRPVFSSFAGSIYESELIRASIDAHARHAAKLRPVLSGSAKPNLQNRLRLQPNTWQTWPAFLYRLVSILYVKNTAFIVPTFGDYDEVNGLISICPDRWELVSYKDEPYIRFFFEGGRKRRAIELSKVGIITRFQMKSELFGETNEAMIPTLDLISIQQQGIKEGAKNSATFRFMATLSNFSNDDDLVAERESFDAKNFATGGGGGVLLWPNRYKDVKELTPHSYSVDAEQARVIKDNVYGYFATNEDVIQNKAYGDAWLAFYEGGPEWVAVNLSESISKMLYSERERIFGNGVFFTANRLQYMSNADKLTAISQMADRGLMTRNELRDIMNLSPLPEPFGSQIPARGEYYDVKSKEENQGDETGGPADGSQEENN